MRFKDTLVELGQTLSLEKNSLYGAYSYAYYCGHKWAVDGGC